MNPTYHEIACHMLGLAVWEDVDPSIREALDSVAELVNTAGGVLRSRQIIALLVAQPWRW